MNEADQHHEIPNHFKDYRGPYTRCDTAPVIESVAPNSVHSGPKLLANSYNLGCLHLNPVPRARSTIPTRAITI